ncbi:unnamed protein product [Ilex paraguariensis]|uniref:DUF295 domain-containing protein n=1 Tax=Ilex paraguariensis TaxID=185542 RepID=A0ABC8QZ42_9AQUA
MEMIVKRVTLTDRIRMSSVCKYWRVILMNEEIKKPVEIPWLMLPQGQIDNQVSFYNLNDEKVYNLKFPESVHGWFCCGSSKGWLVVMTESKFNPNLCLLNPISGAQLRLPCLLTISSSEKFVHPLSQNRRFINKIELSSVDLGEECIVAMICDNHNVLAFCRAGDERWNIFQSNYDEFYVDMLFRNNVFDVMVFSESGVKNCTIKLTDCEVMLRLITFPYLGYVDANQVEIVEFDHFRLFKKIAVRQYLVESNSELLIAQQIMDCFALKDDHWNHHADNPNHFRYFQTNGFEVYKINPNDSHCERLNNLGDHRALFLADSGSLSFSGKEYNGIHGNCIYFASSYFSTFEGLQKTQSFIDRIELSSVDAAQCVVSVVCDDTKVLALCQPGDERWNIFQGYLTPNGVEIVEFEHFRIFKKTVGQQHLVESNNKLLTVQ